MITIGICIFEELVSEVSDESTTLELLRSPSLCVSSLDEMTEEPGPEVSSLGNESEVSSLDDEAEELCDEAEVSSLGEESEELSPDDEAEELSLGELFSLFELLFCGSNLSARVSVTLHTSHVLVSKPSLFVVGAFVVAQFPKEC